MHNRPRDQKITEAKRQAKEKKKLKYVALKGKLIDEYQRKEFEMTQERNKELAIMLTISPDFLTLWNYRKEMVKRELAKIKEEEKDDEERKKILEKEMQLTYSILYNRDIKSYGTWHHRWWIIQQLGKKEWEKDITLAITAILKIDVRNFHCWNYRRNVIGLLKSKEVEDKEMQFLELLFEENPSNYSAWHNRSLILQKKKNLEKALDDEYELCKKMFYTDASDQSAWIYHYSLLDHEKAADIDLLKRDQETCMDLIEAEEEESDDELDEDEVKERDARLKWPILTLTTNILRESTKHPEEMKIQDKFDELKRIDPIRKHYYEDIQSDFIIDRQKIADQQKVVIQKANLTRFDRLQKSVTTTLVTLDLSHNNIRCIPRLFSTPLISLKTLILDDNHIQFIENLESFPALETLSLKANAIAFYTFEKEHVHDQLTTLCLQENPIVENKEQYEASLKKSFPSLSSLSFL
mmetsp:Transcript_11599/g.17153  ORF Transcript_11599/g.17153 Transcript_11599/m.17153 type:complete len:467 (+) Transcript_11599:136-1536(+)